MITSSQQVLPQQPIDLSSLATIQKVLLISDGTLTNIIEVLAGENIQVTKLSEEQVRIDSGADLLDVKPGDEALLRKILLRGVRSMCNYLYAESLIIPQRLQPELRERLVCESTPIGRLWIEHRTETFKEMISMRRERAENLAHFFQILPDDVMLARTYRVFSQQQPVMVITEKFPKSFFGGFAPEAR